MDIFSNNFKIDHPKKLFDGINELSEKQYDEKIKLIAQNPLYSNLYFAKTFYNQDYWKESAKVLQVRGYPQIKDVIPEMFEWLKDINWSGAVIIKKILEDLPKEILIENLELTIKRALIENDEAWLDCPYVFIYENIVKKEDFSDKKLFDILNNCKGVKYE